MIYLIICCPFKTQGHWLLKNIFENCCWSTFCSTC